MKKCTTCGEEKPHAEFHRSGKLADGSARFKTSCKTCVSARIKKTVERGKADQWLTFVRDIDGQDDISPSLRKGLYACKCGKEFAALKRNVKNGNTSSCGCKVLEKSSETHTIHGLCDSPLYSKSSTANYRAKRHGQPDRLTVTQVNALFDNHGWSCYYCGLQSTDYSVMTLDHVVPFNRGGSNTIQNCVPCCKSCNSSKGEKTEQEFLVSFNQGASE